MNQEHQRKLERDGDSLVLVGFVAVVMFYTVVYSPFMVAGALSGRYLYETFALGPYLATGVGIAVGGGLLLLIRLLDGWALNLRDRRSPLHLPFRIVIIAAVASLPFYFGAAFAWDLVGSGVSVPARVEAALLGGFYGGLVNYYAVVRRAERDPVGQ